MPSKTDLKKQFFNEIWYWYLTGKWREGKAVRFPLLGKAMMTAYSALPGTPRCFECRVPLSGFGHAVLKPLGVGSSTFSSRLCNMCEKEARKLEAGAEVELSMLFADVRGSTSLAEATPTLEFKKLIERFYKAASEVLVQHDAMVNRLMGDQVIGLFVPRFAGSKHAQVAIETALDILRATGHEDPNGPWIPVGVGVHTGMAYVGAVGSGTGVNEIAVLGNAPNLAARLSSQAADGEVVISGESWQSAGRPPGEGERRDLTLKGISQPVPVRVLRVKAGQ